MNFLGNSMYAAFVVAGNAIVHVMRLSCFLVGVFIGLAMASLLASTVFSLSVGLTNAGTVNLIVLLITIAIVVAAFASAANKYMWLSKQKGKPYPDLNNKGRK